MEIRLSLDESCHNIYNGFEGPEAKCSIYEASCHRKSAQWIHVPNGGTSNPCLVFSSTSCMGDLFCVTWGF